MEPIFFDSPASFREWLAVNHDRATEVLVASLRGAGRPSPTWPVRRSGPVLAGSTASPQRRRRQVRSASRLARTAPGAMSISGSRANPAGLMKEAGLRLSPPTAPSPGATPENRHVRLDPPAGGARANDKAGLVQRAAPSYHLPFWVMDASRKRRARGGSKSSSPSARPRARSGR
jgi:hypothetical protein